MGAVPIVGSLVLVAGICFLVKERIRRAAADYLAKGPWGILLVAAAFIAYISFCMWLTGSINEEAFVRQLLYFGIPSLMLFTYSLTPFANEKNNSLVFLIILGLWLPVETRWMLKSTKVGGFSYPFVAASAVMYGLLVFQWLGKSNLHLDWSFKRRDLKMVAKVFLIFAAIVIPIGSYIGFIDFGVSEIATERPYVLPIMLVAMWFFPALTEEIVFRAGIQNILSDKLGKIGGWLLASVIFGFAHVNNKVEVGTGEAYRYFGWPNWYYVFLATLGGLAYGYVYRKLKDKGSLNALGAAALLHAVVDFTWRLLFMGGL